MHPGPGQHPHHHNRNHCEMKGFLTFLVLWLIRKKPMTGAEIIQDLESRKGSRPSPGTIYPVLKDLKERGFISVDKNKSYSLTKRGEKALEANIQHFFQTFHDIDEMRSCCKEKK